MTAEFVRLGIHPLDEVGHEYFNEREWWRAFVKRGDNIHFAPDLTHLHRNELSGLIIQNQYELVEDVIFANTFFALEETGLAYPSISRGEVDQTREMDAWLRVFAGAYRVKDNKYFSPDARQWIEATDVPRTNRVRKFASKVFGENADTGLTEILRRLRDDHGHHGGIIEVGTIYLRLSREGDPYWRCPSCERIHLHRGVSLCTPNCPSSMRSVAIL
jgi:hypothetical protein